MAMELKDFIEQTVVEIFDGVKAAQNKLEENGIGGEINPQKAKWIPVQFDIAVTTVSSTTGGGSIRVLGVGADMGGQTSHEAVSRIKFDVPVQLP